MWRLSLAASLKFGDFLCVLPWLLYLIGSTVPGSSLPGLSSHLDPAGGRSSRQIQGKTSEFYRRF